MPATSAKERGGLHATSSCRTGRTPSRGALVLAPSPVFLRPLNAERTGLEEDIREAFAARSFLEILQSEFPTTPTIRILDVGTDTGQFLLDLNTILKRDGRFRTELVGIDPGLTTRNYRKLNEAGITAESVALEDVLERLRFSNQAFLQPFHVVVANAPSNLSPEMLHGMMEHLIAPDGLFILRLAVGAAEDAWRLALQNAVPSMGYSLVELPHALEDFPLGGTAWSSLQPPLIIRKPVPFPPVPGSSATPRGGLEEEKAAKRFQAAKRSTEQRLRKILDPGFRIEIHTKVIQPRDRNHIRSPLGGVHESQIDPALFDLWPRFVRAAHLDRRFLRRVVISKWDPRQFLIMFEGQGLGILEILGFYLSDKRTILLNAADPELRFTAYHEMAEAAFKQSSIVPLLDGRSVKEYVVDHLASKILQAVDPREAGRYRRAVMGDHDGLPSWEKQEAQRTARIALEVLKEDSELSRGIRRGGLEEGLVELAERIVQLAEPLPEIEAARNEMNLRSQLDGWFTLKRRREDLLKQAYWAQLDFLEAIGVLGNLLYPAIGADVSVARAASHVLAIDPDAGRERVELVYTQAIEPLLADWDSHNAVPFEELWNRIEVIPRTVGEALSENRLKAFIQTAHEQKRPITLFLKGFIEHIKNASHQTEFLSQVMAQLVPGDFVVLFGRDRALADTFQWNGFVNYLDRQDIPDAVRQTLRQAETLLGEDPATYHVEAMITLFFAQPFVVLQKPIVELPAAIPHDLAADVAQMIRVLNEQFGSSRVSAERPLSPEEPGLASLLMPDDGRYYPTLEAEGMKRRRELQIRLIAHEVQHAWFEDHAELHDLLPAIPEFRALQQRVGDAYDVVKAMGDGLLQQPWHYYESPGEILSRLRAYQVYRQQGADARGTEELCEFLDLFTDEDLRWLDPAYVRLVSEAHIVKQQFMGGLEEREVLGSGA